MFVQLVLDRLHYFRVTMAQVADPDPGNHVYKFFSFGGIECDPVRSFYFNKKRERRSLCQVVQENFFAQFQVLIFIFRVTCLRACLREAALVKQGEMPYYGMLGKVLFM